MLSGLLLLVTGIFFVYFEGRNVFHERAAVRWPTSKGVIVRSEKKALEDTENDNRATMIADIEYEYKVSGVLFNGTQIYLGTTRNSLSLFSSKVAQQYPVGQEVTVHYNSTQPTESFLEPGITDFVFIMLLAGPVMAVSGFIILAFVFSRIDQGIELKHQNKT